MLVLQRMVGETVRIGDLHAVTVLKILPDRADLLVMSGGSLLKLKTFQLLSDQVVYLNPTRGLWSDDLLKVGGASAQITLVGIREDKARIGITCPKNLEVHRHEVWEALRRERGEDDGSAGSRVPRPSKPNPPSLDVRLDEPRPDDEA